HVADGTKKTNPMRLVTQRIASCRLHLDCTIHQQREDLRAQPPLVTDTRRRMKVSSAQLARQRHSEFGELRRFERLVTRKQWFVVRHEVGELRQVHRQL